MVLGCSPGSLGGMRACPLLTGAATGRAGTYSPLPGVFPSPICRAIGLWDELLKPAPRSPVPVLSRIRLAPVINMSPPPKIPSPSPTASCGCLQPAPATGSLAPGDPWGPAARPPGPPFPSPSSGICRPADAAPSLPRPPIPLCHPPPTPKQTAGRSMNSFRFNLHGASAWGEKNNTFFPFFFLGLNLYLGSYLLILLLIPQRLHKEKSPILRRPEMQRPLAAPGRSGAGEHPEPGKRPPRPPGTTGLVLKVTPFFPNMCF